MFPIISDMAGHDANCTLITIGRRPTQTRQQEPQTNGKHNNEQGKQPVFAYVKALYYRTSLQTMNIHRNSTLLIPSCHSAIKCIFCWLSPQKLYTISTF